MEITSYGAVLALTSMGVWSCRIYCCLQEEVWGSDFWGKEDSLEDACAMNSHGHGQFAHFELQLSCLWSREKDENYKTLQKV